MENAPGTSSKAAKTYICEMCGRDKPVEAVWQCQVCTKDFCVEHYECSIHHCYVME